MVEHAKRVAAFDGAVAPLLQRNHSRDRDRFGYSRLGSDVLSGKHVHEQASRKGKPAHNGQNQKKLY